jgi:hypothetical protein
MCPGAFAYFPVGKVAQLFDKLNVKRSNALIGAFFGICVIFLLGIMTLPLYWLNYLGISVSIGYVVLVLIYSIVFLLTICPKCAMRFNCPAAKLSNIVHKKIFEKDILDHRQEVIDAIHSERN